MPLPYKDPSAVLTQLQYSFTQTKEIFAANVGRYSAAFSTDVGKYSAAFSTDAIAPPISLPLALAAGVAAVVIRNPVVKRRLLWW
jgi:hypothetical protein